MVRWSAALLAVATALAFAAPAGAWEIAGEPWPGPSIAVHVAAPQYSASVRRAVRAWNGKRIGIRFRRTASRENADVVVRYVQRGRGCGGAAAVGYVPDGASRIFVGRDCPHRTARDITAAHELGHVLGLGHERKRCALMNRSVKAAPRYVPGRCSRSRWRFWRRALIGRDDVRGARELYR